MRSHCPRAEPVLPGARVIATAHIDEARKLVTDLGADATVEHTADLASQVRQITPDGIDVVAHLAGDFGAVDLLRNGDRFVSTMVMSPDQVPTKTAIVLAVYANPTPEVLERCVARHARGEAEVSVQHVYPLDQVTEAFDRFARGTLGKIIVSTE